ncbi:LOW QUALITY PROTEIN: probable nucleoredoxin 1 [Typha latifolia]|uniref:LOW QUALITY PROTEIN: probable nucleoredoxin 1 n=1 Tax=Typha latifolia TaxID=4733 RepID=UPI003C30A110
MAEAEGADNGRATHEVKALLSTEARDFLVRTSGDQVNVSSLDGKIVGLYFSASWCGPCHRFTPKLVKVYNELSSKGSNFEVVFVSADKSEDLFDTYFSSMPWLAIPFLDNKTRDHLNDLFEVNGIPTLVILDESGMVVTDDAVEFVSNYGSEGYPFTPEKIASLKEEEEAAKKNQTLRSVLTSPSREFVVSNAGKKVPIAELEGEIVALYFHVSSFRSCREFTPQLSDMYKKLKEKGESFEVVLVPLDDDQSSYDQAFKVMPWLSVPFKDETVDRLVRYFELRGVPTLIILGSDGKTLHGNAAELVEEHGTETYPFTQEKLEELEQKEKARMEAQTLESLLVTREKDYVIGKGDVKMPVSELVGKNILIYFSAQWCPPCRAFLPKFIEAYHKIKEKNGAFEVILVSSDSDQSSFNDFFSEMPWLALPFGDERKKTLSRRFKITGIPSLVAIAPTGKTVTTEARELVMMHGADAYPFTEDRIKELEAEINEMAKGWPEKVKHALHAEHELVLTRLMEYECDGCKQEGKMWSFYCEECDFCLHPKCALEEDTEKNDPVDGKNHGEKQAESGKEGYVCDGEVCYKA